MSIARIELVLRRDALRSLDANTLADLSALNWSELVSKRLRLVELDPIARCDANKRAELKHSLATVGVSATLRALPEARREWLRRHLVPSPIQHDVGALIRSLDTQVSCVMPMSVAATPTGRRLVCIDPPDPHRRFLSDVSALARPSARIEAGNPQKGIMAA